jgi:hypothetical protein
MEARRVLVQYEFINSVLGIGSVGEDFSTGIMTNKTPKKLIVSC